jgi:phage shock protein PspC (stress-responsive transcriptional regulator)
MSEKTDFRERKLYRSQANRLIGGVCGGIAEYFTVDPTLVRLIWVAVSFFGGIGVLLYIAALFIIPNNPEQTPAEKSEVLIKDKYMFWGSLLIIVGAFLLLRQMGVFYSFEFWHIPWQSVWAIILIIIGALLLFNRDKEKEGGEISSKKLYRSKTQKMISGVCGGLAEYFEIDVSIIRVLWVLGTIISAGIGIVAYIIMYFVFPEQPENINDESIEV